MLSRESADAPLNPQIHDEFAAFVALYYAGELSEEEWALLQIHMGYCDSCHERFLQYQEMTAELIPAMAGAAASQRNDAPVESASALRAAEQRLLKKASIPPTREVPARKTKLSWRVAAVAIAVCIAIFACLSVVHRARLKDRFLTQDQSHISRQPNAPAAVAKDNTPNSVNSRGESEKAVAGLRKQLTASENRFKQAATALDTAQRQRATDEANTKSIAEERAELRARLAAAQEEAATLRAQTVSAGAGVTQQERRIAELQTQVHELNISLEERGQELNEKTRLLSLDKDFLDHDRDIRNVIGARNLYIADITDINPDGKQAKQFGRIFYTKEKSLIFYGFDLDSQAGRKQDVAFQVWGSSADRSTPVSLGLFYQDDARKRWVLRCNDPKMLTRLNMVFVTVEPPGGSAKPTGKQLLRTYLQIDPNHP